MECKIAVHKGTALLLPTFFTHFKNFIAILKKSVIIQVFSLLKKLLFSLERE